MTWEPAAGDRIRCTRHRSEFGPRETCAKCITDPGPILTEAPEEPAPAPPEGCLDADQHERRLTEAATLLEERAKTLLTGKGRINYATAAKMYEVALKFYNAAAAYSSARVRREHVKRLERRRRDLHMKRGSN